MLRELGLSATSAAAIRSVRSYAQLMGVDSAHFNGQYRWREDDLRAAINSSTTWNDVADRLGFEDKSAVSTIKGHAARLGIGTRHLAAQVVPPRALGRPQVGNLDRAGPLLAAAWFLLCGHDVSWPLEPSRFDLLVTAEGETRRVQVKTTTVRAGNTWKVYLSTTGKTRRTYDPAEIDDFFIIDGDRNYFLIPLVAVGGLQAIHLNGYKQYRVESWVGVPDRARGRPPGATGRCEQAPDA